MDSLVYYKLIHEPSAQVSEISSFVSLSVKQQ